MTTPEIQGAQPGPALQVAVQRALSAWDTTTLKTNGDGMLCEAMESLRAEFDSAVMLNGLTEAETSQTASVMGLVGERTSVNDGALVFARVMEYQGKTRREVVNPCLTARECIALANYIHASDRAHLARTQAPEGVRTADRLAEAMAELAAIADPCSISTGAEYKRRAGKALEALKALQAAQLAAADDEPICPIDECYGDCPTNPATCPNPCSFEGRSYAAAPAPAEGDATPLRLTDGQWVNIVNHAHCYRDMSKDDAVNLAVKLTEARMAANAKTAAHVQPKGTAIVREGWKHDCAALLTNDVELWVDRCPHCGKPAPAAQAPAPAPAPELTESREYKHAMGDWLGAVGELIEAMGRPKFAADTPVAVIAEAIREAAKRLAAASPAVVDELREQLAAAEKSVAAYMAERNQARDRVRELRAELDAQRTQTGQVPAGFALVPLQATFEMVSAFHEVTDHDQLAHGNCQSRWRAMLAVASKPPVQKTGGE